MRGKTRTFKFITFIKNVYLFMWGNKAKQFPVDIRIQESGRQIPVSREVDGNFSSNRITTNHICTVLEEQFTGLVLEFTELCLQNHAKINNSAPPNLSNLLTARDKGQPYCKMLILANLTFFLSCFETFLNLAPTAQRLLQGSQLHLCCQHQE